MMHVGVLVLVVMHLCAQVGGRRGGNSQGTLLRRQEAAVQFSTKEIRLVVLKE